MIDGLMEMGNTFGFWGLASRRLQLYAPSFLDSSFSLSVSGLSCRGVSVAKRIESMAQNKYYYYHYIFQIIKFAVTSSIR